jgi:poly(A) polymerase
MSAEVAEPAGFQVLRSDPYTIALSEIASRRRAGPLYLVGGYLRDRLLGLSTAGRIDLDLVFWGDPAPFGQALAAAFGGTWFAVDPDTVRILARDREPPVRIDLVRPKAATIEGDLVARDFTINAMGVRLDPLSGELTMALIDPTQGLDDLHRRLLRAIAPTAFDQDPARLIRAVRLSAQFDLTVEDATTRAITERAPLLATAAGERVRDELFKILDMSPAATPVTRLDELHLLQALVPEIGAMKSVPASAPHRLPLWEHSLETLRSVELLLARLEEAFPGDAGWLRERLAREVEAAVTEAAILKLVGLLHDIGKPETRTVDPSGRVRFIGHEKAGLPHLAGLCERLRLGRRAASLIRQIVTHHLRPIRLSHETVITAKATYRFLREAGDAAPLVLLHSWADLRATAGEDTAAFTRHAAFVRESLRFYRTDFAAITTAPLLRGDDVMAAFGLEPGPLVGLALEQLHEAQATGIVRDKAEALAYIRRHLPEWQRGADPAALTSGDQSRRIAESRGTGDARGR